MYRNTERLGQAMARLADRFGVESLLADPRRTRNLLLDEYGSAGRTESSDIDEFVSALTSGTGDLVQHVEPVEVAAERLMRRTPLSRPDALWTVSTLRSIDTTASPPPPPPPPGSSVPPPAPSSIPTGDRAPTFDTESSTIWPRSARWTLVTVGAIAVLAIVAGILVAVRSDSSIDDARVERDQALTQLEALESRPADDPIDTTTGDDAVADDGAGDDAASSSDAPGELERQVAAQATTIEQQQADIERLEAENAQLASDSATTSPARAPAPFSVDPAGVVPSTEEFSGNLTLQECEGFSEACAPQLFLAPSFQREGEQVFVNLPNRARVPVASFDGLTFGGQATVIDSASFTCNGVPKVTNLAIQMSPVRFTIDPQNSSVTVTAYNVLVTRSTPADACTAAMNSFAGTLTID